MKQILKDKKLGQDINVLISQAYSLNVCKDQLQEEIEVIQKNIAINAIEIYNQSVQDYRQITLVDQVLITENLTQYNSQKNIITDEI